MSIRNAGWRTALPWVVLLIWMLLVAGGLASGIASGQNPTDFRSYSKAVDQINQGESPYGTVAESEANWLEMNQSVEAQYSSQSTFQVDAELVPGPYVYPPTLALILGQLNIGPLGFVLILILSTFGFAWLWLRETQAKSTWWVLLIIFSLDVVIFIGFGNVEIFLLFITLLAAWLIWYKYAVIAGLFIAIAVLIKPFFVLFFAGYCLIMIAASSKRKRSERIKLTAVSALTSIGLIILEILRWPEWLRSEALRYYQQGLAHQWFVLPLSQQEPMNIWNRSFLQVFINFGVDAATAQWLSLGVWAVFVSASIWFIWSKKLNFDLIFALALVLFLIGRPVSWTLPFLGFVVVVALWSYLDSILIKRVVLTCAILSGLSHWIAFTQSINGVNANLVTLQGPNLPWEILVIIPLAWGMLLVAVHQANHS